jgi:biotin carboxylase
MKKILILGASRYYIRSIEATRRAGYYVIAIDRSPESEGFKAADESYVCDIIDKEGVLQLAKKIGIDAIIPVNDYGVPTAAYVMQRLGIKYISEETAEAATNKEEMRKRWIKDGIPCPKVEVGNTVDEIRTAIEKVGLPCILKPAHGYGGASRGVIVLRERTEIEEAIGFSMSFYADPSTLIESFVESIYEHSAEVLVYNGIPHVIAISDKIKTPLPYRVDKNVLYPSKMFETERINDLKKIISDAVRSIGINIGAAHVELATTQDGFVLFELGARCGGGGTPEPIVHYSTGVNEFVEQVRILAGDKPVNLIPDRTLGCSYHFITPRPGKIKAIRGIDEISKLSGVLDFEFFKKPGDEVSEVKVGTERAGFIITGAVNREEAYKIGCQAESMLDLSYYIY